MKEFREKSWRAIISIIPIISELGNSYKFDGHVRCVCVLTSNGTKHLNVHTYVFVCVSFCNHCEFTQIKQIVSLDSFRIMALWKCNCRKSVGIAFECFGIINLWNSVLQNAAWHVCILDLCVHQVQNIDSLSLSQIIHSKTVRTNEMNQKCKLIALEYFV